jgi:N utilization substance protein A
MSSELYQAIEQIGREKGIDTDVIIAAVEAAFAAASRKFFRTNEVLGSRLNRETGAIEVFAKKTIVEEVVTEESEITLEDAREIDPAAELGGTIEFSKPSPELGRIAAQAAKQVIYQKVKEAERENIHAEYSDRLGELVNGIVKRFERGDLVVDLGKTEAVLPRREQSRAEHYNQGDRIRTVIVDVDKMGKGPQVTVSRTDPRLLMKLFEMEVPEIYDGTVVIMSVAREAGDRAKIAVRSKDRDVDPVGACVGIKGSRVQAVIRELRGEKIDIVQWDDDPRSFVHNALNPAQINRVYIKDENAKEMEVIVADDQLSLAIGKKGQNVRLASRLVGWDIEIKSESDKKSEVEAEMERVARARAEFDSVDGLGDKVITKLMDAGFRSVLEIAGANFEELTSIPGIGEKMALKIFDLCTEAAPRIEAEHAAREAAEAEARAAAEAEARAAGPRRRLPRRPRREPPRRPRRRQTRRPRRRQTRRGRPARRAKPKRPNRGRSSPTPTLETRNRRIGLSIDQGRSRQARHGKEGNARFPGCKAAQGRFDRDSRCPLGHGQRGDLRPGRGRCRNRRRAQAPVQAEAENSQGQGR